jgi:hypothetical protein
MSELNWFWILMICLVLLLPIGTVYIFKQLARLIPIPQKCLAYRSHFGELRKKYHKWDLLGGLLGFAGLCLGAWSGWFICRLLCSWRSSGMAGVYVLAPSWGICLFPSVPLGIATALVIGTLSMKLILKERFQEMECYAHLRMGFNVTAFNKYFLYISILLSIIFTFLPLNTYMVITEHEVRFNPLLGLTEKVYSYSDIREVQEHHYIKNRFKTDITIKLGFNDGREWKSGDTQELPNEKAVEIAKFLSRQSGIELKRTESRRK